MNDTLRGDYDADGLGRSLTDMVAALTAGGATVLTARLPDPGRMFGLPGLLLRRSTDLMPSLARLAAEEFWSGVRHDDGAPQRVH